MATKADRHHETDQHRLRSACRRQRPGDAAGWPYPYIVDGHGLSSHGSTDLMGLLMGIDRRDLFGLILNFAACLAILLNPAALWLRWQSRAAPDNPS